MYSDDAGESSSEGDAIESGTPAAANSNTGRNSSSGTFFNFRKRQAKGTLFKLAQMPSDVEAQMNTYINEGHMDNDLRFAREVFGLVNTSGRKDFNAYWESPWLEEHIRDTAKRRKVVSQNKEFASRQYMRNLDDVGVGEFINNFDNLRKWQEDEDVRENVKTVSRLIQSFERVAVRAVRQELANNPAMNAYMYRVDDQLKRLQGEHPNDVTPICHSLQRSDAMFDLFAMSVAMEITWADATSGSRNLSVKLTDEIKYRRKSASIEIIRRLGDVDFGTDAIDLDEVGLPLMKVNYNLCISRGVLLVGPNSTNATYVLDIEGSTDSHGVLDLTGVKTITITQEYSGEISADRQPPPPPPPPPRLDTASRIRGSLGAFRGSEFDSVPS
jgi:hypothetical protein